jgi:hypothetical protein
MEPAAARLVQQVERGAVVAAVPETPAVVRQP